MEEKKDFKSGWNMQELLIQGAYMERQAANRAFLGNNYSKACRHLIALKQMLIGIMSREERDALNEIEQRFIVTESANMSLKQEGLVVRKEGDNRVNLVRKNLHKIYTEYNDLIMDLLQAKHILLNAKTDDSRLIL